MPFATNPDGTKIHYEVEGAGSPLVLVHGFGGSLETWRERGYVDALKNDLQLILIDARGHGQSDRPTNEEDYDWRSRVLDVVAVLGDLELEKAHLLGYSMGGAIAQSCNIYAPQRFHSLIIGGSSPYGMAGDGWAERPFEEMWAARAERDESQRDVIAAGFASLGKFNGSVQALSMRRVPALLFAGTEDHGPIEGVQRLAAAEGIPALILEGKDHGTAVDAVEVVAPRVLEFVREVEASA